MRRRSFRFRPPPRDLPVEVRWALGRAFSGPQAPSEEEVDPLQARHWARVLALEPRIAHRASADDLDRDLGAEVAQQFLAIRRKVAMRGMNFLRLAHTVAEFGIESRMPVVLLKGAALLDGGFTALGSRDVGDLDVLVPPQDARLLAQLLASKGFRSEGGDKTSRHLPTLFHPSFGVLDIHVHIQDVYIRGGDPITAEGLLLSGLCRESQNIPGAYVPNPTVLAAHAITHAIVQHGCSPHMCPPLRMVGDLFDLSGQDPRRIDSLLEDGGRLIRRRVSERELQAVSDLCGALARGSPDAHDGDAGALIRHAVAGTRDPAYQRSLRISAFLHAVARRDWKKLKSRILAAVVPGR